MRLGLELLRTERVAASRALCALCLAAASAAGGQAAAAAPEPSPVVIRFLDSATGYALQPDVTVRPEQAGAPEKSFGPSQVAASGHGTFALEAGWHTLTVAALGYQPMSAPLVVPTNSPYQIRVLLDPLELPPELRPEDIEARQREGMMLIQGFIVDEDSSEPLGGVRVASTPSGVQSVTDARGFYQIYLPVPEDATEVMANVSVAFEKPGYQARQQQYWELWSGGDWTYNVRLHRGAGREVVDGRKRCRAMEPEELAPGARAASSQPAPSSALTPLLSAPVERPLEAKFALPEPTDPATATVRVPRNIRVLDGTNDLGSNLIYYVTMDFYENHTLQHEWYASWGKDTNHPGGTNALNAGAVAVRCYAINRLNGKATDSTHDICGDSQCQNFDITGTSLVTGTAITYTAGCVLVNTSGNIPSTEYASENNSKDMACGDGFTAPTGGFLYDPVCAGRTRNGHGRGMCQWGSKFWATGEKGFPPRDWVWILYHYYPNLRLVRGAPLLIGDNVRAESKLDVRACSGGGIESGYSCQLLTNKAVGQTGGIIDGPLVVTNDYKGFTWYKVRWNDAKSTEGWSCESFLERDFSAPGAPSALSAVAVGTNRIDLTWTETSSVAAGFSIERAPAAGGPWLEIGRVTAAVQSFTDGNLYVGSTWYYRVLAYNAAGNSAYSAVATATTPGVPPTLSPVYDRQAIPGTLITFTYVASAPERVQLITDLEPFMSETANGVVVFRTPNFSTSTSGFLDSAPDKDIAALTDTYPTTGHGTGIVLYVKCNFTNGSNPWLRLTTSGADTFPNPVIDFTKKLRFDIYADSSVKVAVGCRETTTPAGTVIGADGGTTGASIEWAGVTNIAGTAPMPTRVIASNTWTTLTFDLPHEPIRSFSGGNGVLSTASGLGVLEHLAIVPAGLTTIPAGSTNNLYKVYLDNFAVLVARTFTYSLGAGAPTNASLDPTTGVFGWTPTAAQCPSTNLISIIVTDNSTPPWRATNTFSVFVKEYLTNGPPVLDPIPNQTVYARSTLTLPIGAYDPDAGDILTFSLGAGPTNASLNATTGVFTWTPADADTNSIHPITVRVTDNGSPPLSATAAFSVTVIPPPPLNTASYFSPVGNRTVNAGSTLTFRIYAWDDNPGDTLTFSLSSDSPADATIDTVTGVFAWTPEDALSNTVHSVTARVTDDGQPRMTGSTTFSVTVLPHLPNHPPVLAAVPDQTVHAGSAVVFTNTASDEDTADTLSFSLDDNALAGANIDTVSGIFTWAPTDADSNTTNSITVWVTDDGEPPLSASATAVIVVRSKPILQAVLTSATTAALTWSAIPNVKYRVLYKNSLLAPLWETLGPDIIATGSTATTSDTGLGAVPQRFYRVLVVD